MDHRAIYSRIMARAADRKLTADFELHHIVPKAWGGSDVASNTVRLTYREHFLAHWLLTRFAAGDQRRRMEFALHRMGNRSKIAWQYAEGKAALVRANRGATLSDSHKKKLSETWSPERRQKARDTLTATRASGRLNGGGDRHSKDGRRPVGNRTNHPKAHELSAETRAKLRAAAVKGNAKPMTEARRLKRHIAGRKRWQSPAQLEML
jgi:hypothetical protein